VTARRSRPTDAKFEYLDLDDALTIAEKLFGTPVPLRDVGLLGSALARPQTSVGGSDAYPTIWEKAAALLISVVNNHSLVDGNKRLGWVCAAVFCEINGRSLTQISNDDVFDLVTEVARGNASVPMVAARISSMYEAGRTKKRRG
jgi:death-on-curing protein